MRKFLYIIGVILLVSCQSIGELSIDYMQPGDVSFPATLRRVGIVNNAYPIQIDSIFDESGFFIGDAQITTESLAKAIAAENYFDEVVICDSLLYNSDSIILQNTLSQQQVKELTQLLETDFIISVDGILLEAKHEIAPQPAWQVYQGILDVKIHPFISIYLPTRQKPLLTIHDTDSIFWREFGNSEEEVIHQMPSKESVIAQSSEYASEAIVKKLLPTWKNAQRFYFIGAGAEMRDGDVYVREGNWEKAIESWQVIYDTQKGKRKMQAAYNLALGYEMQDNIEKACELIVEAEKIATEINDTYNQQQISSYAKELQKRKASLIRLKSQMQRFEADF